MDSFRTLTFLLLSWPTLLGCPTIWAQLSKDFGPKWSNRPLCPLWLTLSSAPLDFAKLHLSLVPWMPHKRTSFEYHRQVADRLMLIYWLQPRWPWKKYWRHWRGPPVRWENHCEWWTWAFFWVLTLLGSFCLPFLAPGICRSVCPPNSRDEQGRRRGWSSTFRIDQADLLLKSGHES